MTDTEFSQAVNPQSFCTGVSLHHPALIQNTGPLIDMSDIRPGTSECWAGCAGGEWAMGHLPQWVKRWLALGVSPHDIVTTVP